MGECPLCPLREEAVGEGHHRYWVTTGCAIYSRLAVRVGQDALNTGSSGYARDRKRRRMDSCREASAEASKLDARVPGALNAAQKGEKPKWLELREKQELWRVPAQCKTHALITNAF